MNRLSAGSRAGFSLLELVVVLALISLISGAVAPALGTLVDSKSRRVTKLEMEQIGAGVLRYFQDTGSLPSGVQDLIASSAAGWAGPYVQGAFDDPISGNNGYLVDAWSRPFVFGIVADTLTITSQGKDGTTGSADDLVLQVNVTIVRRDETVAELRTIQIAIDAYNAVNLVSSPLPANWASIYSSLISNGLLPPAGGYDTDGWGNAYQPDPLGAVPVTRVTSSSL